MMYDTMMATMIRIRLMIYIAVYFTGLLYNFLSCIPVVRSFVKIFKRIALLYISFLLFVARVVRDVCNFGFRVISGCVLLTFLPVYIAMWIVTRLLFAAITVAMGDFANEHVNIGPIALLRLIALSLPVIGPKLTSVEGLVNIPGRIVRAFEWKVDTFKTEVNAILDDVNNNSFSFFLSGGAVPPSKPTIDDVVKDSPSTNQQRANIEREPKPNDQSVLRSEEPFTNWTESSVEGLLKTVLPLVPFGDGILDFFQTMFALPSNCVVYYHRFREAFDQLEKIYKCPSAFIDKIKDLDDSLAELESDVADNAVKIVEVQSYIDSRCAETNKEKEDNVAHMKEVDKKVTGVISGLDDVKDNMRKVRVEYRNVEQTTKKDARELSSKADEIEAKYEKKTEKRKAVRPRPLWFNVQTPRLGPSNKPHTNKNRAPKNTRSDTGATGNHDNKSKSDDEFVRR